MSGRGAVLVVGVVAIAAAIVVAYEAWPGGHGPSAPTLGTGASKPALPPHPVRIPDTGPAPSGLAVRFALHDRTGAPVAGVELTAAPDAAGPTASARAGADGVAALPLGPGRWRLAVAGHRVAGAADVELDGAVDHDVPLVIEPGDVAPAPPPEDLGTDDRSGGLTGVVTGGGAHLADVTVSLTYLGGFGPGHPVVHDRAPHPIAIPPRRFLGAPRGYRWPSLPAGSYDLYLASPGWGASHARVTVEPRGWGVGSAELAPAASVSGVVQDGRGVAVAAVVVRAENDGHRLDEAVTGGDGVYLLDGLPAGVVTLTTHIAKDVCLSTRDIVTIEAGKRATHRIEMTCAWQGR